MSTVKLNTKQMDNLEALMCELPDAYNRQIRMTKTDAIVDFNYFDCEMYSWQREPKEPIIENGVAKWKIYYNYYNDIDENGKIIYSDGYLSIPSWLYYKYLNGDYDFISCRKVLLEDI